MKRLFLFALSGFIFMTSANAQITRKSNPSQRVQSDTARHHHKNEMMSQLNLNQDQKSQLKSLRQSNKLQRDNIKNDPTLTQTQKKEKMKELRQSQSDKMNSILTPEQQTKRKAYIQKMKAKRKMN
jgi:Spy/CpxP family protein refolding chaperone